MRAVFMPERYRVEEGEVDVASPSEICSLLGMEPDDLDQLQLPSGDVFYISRSAQRSDEAVLNRAATFVLKEKLPLGIGLRGPALFVPSDRSITPMPRDRRRSS